jgi:N-methylhydantoinase A/oxoprolinase/acetone carboxylase beta subunit
MKEVISTRADISALRALITMGWVRQIGFTPTDAAHVLGECADWDAEAAETAAILMARQRDGSGQSVRPDAGSFCQWAIETLIETSSHHVLNAALSHDQLPTVDPNTNPIASAGLARHSGASTIKLGLGLPLVGLGASASVYYPEIGRRLSVNAIVPKDADVANAVGAVAGQVRLSREALVTCPADGLFRAHLSKGNQEFSDLDAAKDALLRDLSKIVREEAQFAGASEIALTSAWSERTAEVEGKRIVIEIKLRITATGRPKIGSWLPQATSSTGSLRT